MERHWSAVRSALCLGIALLLAAGPPGAAQQPPGVLSATDYVTVGRDGVALQTADDGASWASVTPTRGYINGVVSDNRGHFVAVASDGIILRSGDGGASWDLMTSGTTENLADVAWADDGRFVAVGYGGTILVSQDGGTSWQRRETGTPSPIMSVGTDGRGGWVAGGAQGLILYSSDSAATWGLTNTRVSGHVNGLASLGDGRWIAVGIRGRAASSEDGGKTWSPVETGVRQTFEAVAADSATVVAVGWNGTIARSEDRGTTWTGVTSGTRQRLTGVTVGRDGAFAVVGWRGTWATSSDAGRTWSVKENLTGKALQAVAYNRLPDLTVSGLELGEGCQVVVTVANRGPATVPPEGWGADVAGLRVLRGGESWVAVPMAELDSAKVLRPAGGRLTRGIGALAGTDTVAVEAMIDPHNAIAEAGERNNSRTRRFVCPAR